MLLRWGCAGRHLFCSLHATPSFPPSLLPPTLSLPLTLSPLSALPPISTPQVCPFSGIVIVGHQGGEVRVYQFTDCAQPAVHRMNVDENGLPYDNVGPQVSP